MWYLSKVKYRMHDAKAAKDKTVTEAFLHEAISYGEVEKQLAELMPPRVKDYGYKLTDQTFTDVVFHKDGEHFYKIKVKYTDDETVFSSNMLMPADTPEEATERAYAFLKNSQIDYEVCNVDKTPILAVWHPHNEIWQGDWHTRIENLEADGRRSVANNQIKIDFDAPQPAGTGVALRHDSVIVLEAEDMGNGHDPVEHRPLQPILELPPAQALLPDTEGEEDFYAHYDAALDELRTYLDYEEYRLVRQAAFCRKWGVSRSFFANLCDFGALEIMPKKTPVETSHFRLTDRINTLTWREVQTFIKAKDETVDV